MVSLRFLLDTNVVSEATRLKPNPIVIQRLLQHQGQMGIASVVWNELLFGWKRLPPSRKKTEIEHYLLTTIKKAMPILPYDEVAAVWHARERARLTAIGRTPPPLDGQIAATAKAHALVLVTFNRIHFEGFEGLEIEDWRS